MNYIKDFNNFSSVNEEEVFGLFVDKQRKIKELLQEFLSGNYKNIEKAILVYNESKPSNKSNSDWSSYIYNILDLSKSGKKPGDSLEDAFGKNRPAIDVIEEEIARIVLKDRLVIKDNGKWIINEKGRSFSKGTHTFGGDSK